jgi:LAS superfamily LD-carboxypeptidase LdcB
MTYSMSLLTGQSRDHLELLSDGIWLHRDVIAPFRYLQTAAMGAGIALTVASGYRDFARQLAIWNDKAAGKRPVLSADGVSPLDISQLAPEELMFAILRWSALPGASRHHWGTDMDVWDSAAVPLDYRLQLTPDEYSAQGPFARLAGWLEEGEAEALGFYRPYQVDRGGVSPEPWHLSCRPIAENCARYFDLDQYAELIERADIALKAEILANLDEIFQRFVRCP